MKTLLYTFLVLLAVPAWAEVRLDPPAKLVETASLGRTQLRNVIFEIEKNLPEFSDLPSLTKYMQILPQLQAISDKHRLEEIYPRGVAILGETVFGAALKWLDPRNVQQSTIQEYVKFASFDLALHYIEVTGFILASENNLERLAIGTDIVEALRLQFLQQWPKKPSLNLGCLHILSDVSSRVLARTDLTELQIEFWILKLSSAQGFASFLDLMNAQILMLTKDNVEASRVYLKRLKLLHGRMKLFERELPSYLPIGFGDQSVELLVRMISLEVRFTDGEFESILNLMVPRHVRSLVQQLTGQEPRFSPAFADEYNRLTRLLLERLTAENLMIEAKFFAEHLQKLGAYILAQHLNAEGHYVLTDRTGQKWNFSLIVARNQQLFAALCDSDEFSCRSYFNVTVDEKGTSFIASQREPDADPNANATIRFKITSNGELIIEDLYSMEFAKTLKGKKTISWPEVSAFASPSQKIAGRYAGVVEYVNGRKVRVEVIVTQFQGFSTGRLKLFDDQNKLVTNLEYHTGSRANDALLSLTTGRLESGKWNHLRGYVVGNELHGYLIIGGQGMLSKKFVLKRL